MPTTKNNFLLILVGVLGAGFLVTSIVSYYIARDSLNDRIAGEILPLTSDNIYSEIERDLLRSILISSLMAHDTFLRDWIVGGEQEPDRIIRYLEEIQRKYDTITAFFVSENTRNYYHITGIIKQVTPDNESDGWYFRAREMKNPYEINIDHDTADPSRVTIFINYRVMDRNGDLLGITGIGLAVDAVANLIETYQQRYSRDIYFVDREGKVTLHGGDFEGPGRLQERDGIGKFATRILSNPSSSITYEKPDGELVYVNSRLVPEFDWFLLVEQSKSAAEAYLLDTLMLNALMALLIAALVIVVVYLTIRKYQQRLEQMAMTDKLTGANNRHVFQAVFKHVVGSAGRRGDPVSLLCIDIDHFKELNDTRGHQAGDSVLRQFAQMVRANIRESDTLCRWGGDEFLVLMGGCSSDDAGQIAEKIRAAVAEHPFRFGESDEHVTISIGVAQHHGDETLESLVQSADNALYESKRQGRNRVVYA